MCAAPLVAVPAMWARRSRSLGHPGHGAASGALGAGAFGSSQMVRAASLTVFWNHSGSIGGEIHGSLMVFHGFSKIYSVGSDSVGIKLIKPPFLLYIPCEEECHGRHPDDSGVGPRTCSSCTSGWEDDQLDCQQVSKS